MLKYVNVVSLMEDMKSTQQKKKMRKLLYPYKMASRSGKSLASLMSIKRVYQNKNYKPRNGDIIINWGSTKIPSWINKLNANTTLLNNPNCVRTAVNKLETFRHLTFNGIPTVEWTTKYEDAFNWAENENKVVERHTLCGYGGSGVVVANDSFELNCTAPLYTKFIEKAMEYRLHVFRGNVFDIQQKKRRSGQDTDGTIKNKSSGWVFCRNNITPLPENAQEIAIKTIQVLGLDFGAVDMLVKNGKVYVLEVNTAVGLEGTTLLNYYKQFNA